MSRIELLPNVFTAANMLLGVVALAGVFEQNYNLSIILILVAAIIDRFDGRLARHYNTASAFGKELDSLADLVSFGVAPGALLYVMTAEKWGVAALVCFGLFTLCGGLRLARYNLSVNPAYFLGVPITLAGSLLAVIIYFRPAPAVLLAAGVLLALAMISAIRIPKI